MRSWKAYGAVVGMAWAVLGGGAIPHRGMGQELGKSEATVSVAAEVKIAYVDALFENASPLWYEQDERGALQIHLLYDHERDSPNRAAGHIHFRVHGNAGTTVRTEFNNLENVWNGLPGSVARELLSVVISEDGKEWESLPLKPTEDGRVFGMIPLRNGSIYVARVEPYRLSDCDALLEKLRKTAGVSIETIGKTVEGRPLEVVQIGSLSAPHRVFLRARAHPWEAGGNWVIEGLVERLLQRDEETRRILEKVSFAILPMANKDGVARGRTRFNSRGKDLNRDWGNPADPVLSPENQALESWLQREIDRGDRPDLAIELHNDGNGKLHISRPPEGDQTRYLARMELLESLLRRYTWFTEGSTQPSFRNPGTLGEGWHTRFGIDAVVHEFNCNIIAGLQERPLGKHWRAYGYQLPLVFENYFDNRP
ncbi:M14 family zinc carboxypeptidase [Pirellulaceae bacterium SH467]